MSRANRPVRPGMISNPMAIRNWRTVAHERLITKMPDPLSCISTPSVDDLDWACDYLLFQRGCNVLVINGGDGTIHHAVNAALRVVRAASQRVGMRVPLPLFLFVNGGGMNMLARAYETRGHPIRTLRRFLRMATRRSLGALRTRDVPLLAVREGDAAPRYGFIFGSELVLNALTMYERFGRGYRGLAKFLVNTFAGYAFRTELWRQFGHLLDPTGTPVTIDGREHPAYTAVVASTAPMTLLKGMVGSLRRVAEVDTFDTIEVLETHPGRVISKIPPLMWGIDASGIRYGQGVRELRLVGRYTLDGELMIRPGEPADAPLSVRGTSHLVRGLWLR